MRRKYRRIIEEIFDFTDEEFLAWRNEFPRERMPKRNIRINMEECKLIEKIDRENKQNAQSKNS